MKSAVFTTCHLASPVDSRNRIGAISPLISLQVVWTLNLSALLGPDFVYGRASLSLWELAGRWEVVIRQLFAPWWMLQLKEPVCGEGASLAQ